MAPTKDPYRVCNVCGGVDQHPRHSFTGVIPGVWEPDAELAQTVESNLTALTESGKISVGEAIAIGREFWDDTSTDRHIDCCASAGCPKSGTVGEDGIPAGCDERVAVWNGKTGSGMVAAAGKVREQHEKIKSVSKGDE